MDLNEAREQIDAIDSDLARLLEKRLRVVEAIGEYKARNGIAILDERREAEKLESVSRLVAPPLRPYIIELYRCIMSVSRSYQQRLREKA